MATKAAKVEYGLIDRSGEHTRIGLNIAYDDVNGTVAALATSANLVRVALEALTELNETKVGMNIIAHKAAATLPSGAWAQREHGLRMTYADTVTGKQYRADIPGVDETALRQDGTDVPINTVGLVAFKDAIELTCVSEFGNPISVIGFRFYGKNN